MADDFKPNVHCRCEAAASRRRTCMVETIENTAVASSFGWSFSVNNKLI